MNMAITDGLVLMPRPFSAGLSFWSSGNGTPGSATYDSASNAAFVPADQDFGGCLELQKTQSTQRLRHMGQTPLVPGMYLRITARIKAISGALPSVRIAGWAGNASGGNVSGVVQTGPSLPLTTYGEVVTVSAIVGSGARPGVDMAWGTNAIYGHFGLDLTGSNGGVVRIDDIEIEDVTSAFLRKMMDWVDVRDFGARGDGVTNDRAAFLAADAAAAGRQVLVPAGSYFLGDHVTMNAPVRFEGTVTLPANRRLALTRNFDLATYAQAFGSEMEGLRRGIQALFNFTDHVTFDLCGRRVEVDAPIDVQAAVDAVTSFAVRRGITNGQFNIIDGPSWNTRSFTSAGTYNPNQPLQLTNVTNIANIPVGSLVVGNGVGREVYVREKNVATGVLTLSQPLFDAAGTQQYTFRRFAYVLDFSGFSALSAFEVTNCEFLCNGLASGILLAPEGLTFRVSDCVINRPRDRGITSPGRGCQGMFVDRCQFLSNEMSVRAPNRSTIALNVNANDVKVRNNRVVRFLHFAICNGTGHMFVGNHFFNGDDENNGSRVGGLIMTTPNCKSTITGNYIDNCSIEWTNEHEAVPQFSNQFSFGGLTITGNIFIATNVAPWFRWLVVKPYGPGHFIHGLYVSGNTFRTFNSNIDRVEAVDSTFATLDFGRMRNITFDGNTFNGIAQLTASPVVLRHDQNTAATTWTIDAAPFLPFGGWARLVQSVMAEGPLLNGAGQLRGNMPYAMVEQGPNRSQIQLHWPEAVRGRAQVTVRVDNPN
ncbi:glycosyl hydrolase family 28-related protein [Plastorhodobacter daqingensis]|uniref:Glycosyl hydrolase family 28-related protein n=1 Tax=Plastorhodobacter daqingensis TaxID=1387281 RepID=A0ABW2UK50_9RHOB